MPLFFAGGQEERDFAKDNPCITVDGCDKMCAAKGVEMYGKVHPKSSIIISEIVKKRKTFKTEIEKQNRTRRREACPGNHENHQ